MRLTFYFLILLILALCCNCVYAQQSVNDTLPHQSVDATATLNKDSPIIQKKVFIKRKASPVIRDTSFVNKDSVVLNKDSLLKKADTSKAGFHSSARTFNFIADSILFANKFINVKTPAVLFIADRKKSGGKEFVFYALCIVLFILGLFKTFYPAYFNNLFRVFLNTSIRQTQLTDQLLQAKLPSLILNIFFAISSGFYIWILFKHYNPPKVLNSQLLLPFCILGICALYFVKYCVIKFMGWMSEMQQAADNYIFVIFLVNKIAGIILIPFVILLAFALPAWFNYLTTFSLLLVSLFFLSRYIKTYGLLEYKFPLNPLHFIIYIIAFEITPLLLIYKLVIDYVI